MTRVKGGSRAHQRHKKVLKLARGYRGAKSKLYRPAQDVYKRQQLRRTLLKAAKDRR